MFKSVLFLNWRASHGAIWLLSSVLFLIPLAAVQGIVLSPEVGESDALLAQVLLQNLEAWTPVFPALAFATGVIVALLCWSWDHQEGHAYALSLPTPRSRYAIAKFGSGLLLILIPVGCFAAGCLVATSVSEVPGGLNTYPWSMSLRFWLATVLSFGLFFSMAAGTPRTVYRLLAGGVLFFVLANLALPAMGLGPEGGAIPLLTWSLEGLHAAVMPIRLFTGNWMLIDV